MMIIINLKNIHGKEIKEIEFEIKEKDYIEKLKGKKKNGCKNIKIGEKLCTIKLNSGKKIEIKR